VGNRWIGGAALAVAVALLVSPGCGSETSDDFRGSPPPEGIRLPDFMLREHSGAVTHSDDLQGNVVLVTFLDTQCTEACPVIAGQIGQGLELLSPSERSDVVAFAISSDPQEDTPASVRAFLRRHRVGGTLHYLVGTESELRPVWEAFHVLPSVDTGDDEIHSAPVRLFDRKGVWVATLHAGVDLTPANLAHDIRVALD
jgi:cytochrome oxidase Cu insertion factor (SCO1/SenC/PrrC family)